MYNPNRDITGDFKLRLSEGKNANAAENLLYFTPISEDVTDPDIASHNPVEYAVIGDLASHNPVEYAVIGDLASHNPVE